MSVLLSAPDFWCYVENFLNRKCDFSFTLGEIYLPSSLLAVLPSFFSSSLPTEVYWTPTMYYRPIPCQTFGMEWWVKPTPSLTSQSFPSRMAFLNHKRSWGKGEIKGARRIQGVCYGCLPKKMASKLKSNWESALRRGTGEMESFLGENMYECSGV